MSVYLNRVVNKLNFFRKKHTDDKLKNLDHSDGVTNKIFVQPRAEESIDILTERVKSKNVMENYRVCSTLGRGTFGTVRLCELIGSKNKQVAIKQIRKHHTKIYRDKINMEIYVQTYLAHPAIVRYHEWFEDSMCVNIVMDYVNGSNLYEVCNSYQNNKIPYAKAQSYMKQLLDVLVFLKKNNVVHRDVKPENILIDNNNKIYLCDFGFAITLHPPNKLYQCDVALGSPDYISPEMIKLEKHDYAVDIWAFGVILYEITYGEPPFHSGSVTCHMILHKSVDNVLAHCERNNEYESSQYLINLHTLIRKLLVKDPTKRLKVEECYNEKYFLNNLVDEMH